MCFVKISVIIPTLNEAQLVSRAIDLAHLAGADEVIVSDGGSTDDTVSIARQSNCAVVESLPGRGLQLNTGASHASGDFLLFLHVDTSLPNDGCNQIREAVSRFQVDCGAFVQRIDSRRFVYRLIEFGNLQRVKWLGMAYGDQGIFVRRLLFEEVGGFDDVPLMEDFQFSRKLRQLRHRYFVCEGPILVDPRRWQRHGPLKQTVSNWVTITSFMNGTDVKELAERYRR